MSTKFLRKIALYGLGAVSAFVILGGGILLWLMRGPVPAGNADIAFNKLTAPVTIDYGPYGTPVIHAGNRSDSIRALGFVTARDRLFQMDLMRRKSAGRLAEIFGPMALGSDIRARSFGFNRVAEAVVSKLPDLHRRYLEAYADGVNRFINGSEAKGFEFTLLNYRPEPWKIQDSILTALGMFDILNGWNEEEERMLSVMEASLPKALVAFLTPDTDPFTDELQSRAPSRRPATPIPVAEMSAELRKKDTIPPHQPLSEAVPFKGMIPGSNAWAVSAAKTADGRAILANDMHLHLSVPTIWYRSEVFYGNTHAAGVTLPGLPLIIAGSNRQLAWGETNLAADFLDLVSLDINPDNPGEYKVADSWQPYERITEKITVKGEKDHELIIKQTRWGPLSERLLLGKPVAVRWSALDEAAFNFNLFDLEQAETMEQALSIANRAGTPPLNFLAADENGHIGWTLMGKIPKRFGGDGSVSRSWANGSVGWRGYIDEDELPRQIDPPEGFLVSANDRRLGKDYPHVIGRQFAPGFRAFRISQLLENKQYTDEKSMFEWQLDVESAFYDFYHRLALSVLSDDALKKDPGLPELRDYLVAWDGKADSGSVGFPLLVEFRKQLAQSVFQPFLASCYRRDNYFRYSWTYIDTPLQALLTEKIPDLLPDSADYRNWDEFILAQLRRSAQRLKSDHAAGDLAELSWGKVNKAHFTHPFSRLVPFLGFLLDMPADELSGCTECVRVATARFGASERLVVSPSHLEHAILQIPGGQSGHPLSPFYRDQQDYWVNGVPIPLLADGSGGHRLTLTPAPRRSND
ncbi:MAG: penicillin acylase family protein [Gammaproteobacteria bacterium]